MYMLTKEDLYNDLLIAYKDAKRNKTNKHYVKSFEKDYKEKLKKLCDDLYNKTYEPSHSSCFIVNHPKKREIFAAQFIDRIVHHLYFNYTHELYENTFIADTYSCIKNRGTHYGIDRMKHHILKESNNYNKECYVLKMDIKGYFIHINRNKLIEISNKQLNKMKSHKNSEGKIYEKYLDFNFIEYLGDKIISLNPTKKCIIKSPMFEWLKLPSSKSLFYTENNCGLPIGNLTSQLLSNVFLNELDQYVKRELKCKHYGRYVDDFYIVSTNKNFLHNIIPKIKSFLKEKLLLEINDGKTKIINVKQGVEFLGAFIKPYRTYISNSTLKRIKKKLLQLQNNGTNKNPINSINSYLGILKHYSSFNLRKELFSKITVLYKYGIFNKDYTKFISYSKINK